MTKRTKTYSRFELLELVLEYNKQLKKSKLLHLTDFLDWLKQREEQAQNPPPLPGQKTIDEEIREVEHARVDEA